MEINTKWFYDNDDDECDDHHGNEDAENHDDKKKLSNKSLEEPRISSWIRISYLRKTKRKAIEMGVKWDREKERQLQMYNWTVCNWDFTPTVGPVRNYVECATEFYLQSRGAGVALGQISTPRSTPPPSLGSSSEQASFYKEKQRQKRREFQQAHVLRH